MPEKNLCLLTISMIQNLTRIRYGLYNPMLSRGEFPDSILYSYTEVRWIIRQNLL